MAEVEQILSEGTIDLQRNREQLKSIRRGEWSESKIEEYFTKKEAELETLYVNSKLRHSPDEAAIKQLLIDCLEEHYGSLDNCIKTQEKSDVLLGKVAEIIDEWRK